LIRNIDEARDCATGRPAAATTEPRHHHLVQGHHSVFEVSARIFAERSGSHGSSSLAGENLRRCADGATPGLRSCTIENLRRDAESLGRAADVPHRSVRENVFAQTKAKKEKKSIRK
jgi:hypothetical protein